MKTIAPFAAAAVLLLAGGVSHAQSTARPSSHHHVARKHVKSRRARLRREPEVRSLPTQDDDEMV